MDIVSTLRSERNENYGVTKKRKNSCSYEENPSMKKKKRQKETNEVISITSSKKKITEQAHETYFTGWRIRLHEPKTKPSFETTREIQNNNNSFKDLIAKAKKVMEEKKAIDPRKALIERQRLISRLTLNKIVPTFEVEDHLKYHKELEQLGCDFIHDQVTSLTEFSLSSRSNYTHESNSVLAHKEATRCDDHQQAKKVFEIK